MNFRQFAVVLGFLFFYTIYIVSLQFLYPRFQLFDVRFVKLKNRTELLPKDHFEVYNAV